jgi:signal-transduction protein with cAMP-binding, CBS, and nucleotidyltransferase domain
MSPEGVAVGRVLRYGQLGEFRSGCLQQAPVRAVMSAPVLRIGAASDVAEAAAQMRRERVGCLPVVEGSCVVGMLTEIDILRHIAGAGASGSPELDIVISCP